MFNLMVILQDFLGDFVEEPAPGYNLFSLCVAFSGLHTILSTG